MAQVAVKIKIMPTSPDADLKQIEKKAKELVEGLEGKNCTFVEEPIAFGLKAIIITFGWPEEVELEELEKRLEEIDQVQSVQELDIRRAFGS